MSDKEKNSLAKKIANSGCFWVETNFVSINMNPLDAVKITVTVHGTCTLQCDGKNVDICCSQSHYAKGPASVTAQLLEEMRQKVIEKIIHRHGRKQAPVVTKATGKLTKNPQNGRFQVGLS